MGMFEHVNWHQVLVPGTPLLEIFVRGTLVYFGVLFLLRVFVKRELGSLGISDLIVIVFLADAAQNAMADNYQSIPDGLFLMLVIVGWAWGLDKLAFHVPFFGRLLRPPPVLLIEDGKLKWRNMRRELVTLNELEGQLRMQGIEDASQVQRAFIEQDGRISVIRKDGGEAQGASERKAAA